MVKFGDVVLDTKGKVDRTNNPYDYYIAGDHMDTEDLELHRKGCFATDDVGPAFIRTFKPGQVLYGSRRTYLKKVTVADFEGVTANTTFVFETKDASVLSQELLPFIMWSDKFTDFSILKSRGSTNPYVLFSDLAEYEFDLPDLAKQEELAELLWSMEYTKRAYRKVIAQTDELVNSQFIELFGDVSINGKGWAEAKLGEKAIVGSSKRIFAKEYVSQGVPFYRSKEIIELGNGKKPSVELFISNERYQEIKQKYGVPQPGDILMTAVGTIGKFWTVPDKSPFYYKDGNLVYIRTSEFNISFFKKMLEMCIEDYKIDNANGSAYAALPIERLKNMKIVCPPSELQLRYEQLLQQLDKSKFELQKALDELTAMQKKIIEQNLT